MVYVSFSKFVRMSTKLTLSVDEKVVNNAKKVASRQGTSLSKLVEGFLRNLAREPMETEISNPVLNELSGSIHVPADFDYKKELKEALVKKYIK